MKDKITKFHTKNKKDYFRINNTITFYIDILQIRSLKKDENPDLESDRIIKQKKQNIDGKNVFYEWENNIGFEKVENPKWR